MLTPYILTPPILAAFVTPGLFLAGAGAISLPVLIHLFARRRFKRIRWAAISFLLQAERTNRRRIRLEDWILLALRCLAVLLLGVLFGRPFLSLSSIASAFGGSQRTERIIVLDDSFSMGYETETGTSFDTAKSAVRQLIQAIRQESPNDSMTILRMTEPDAPIESGVYLSQADAEELLSHLEGLQTSQRAIDPGSVLEAVAGQLESSPGVLNAAVYVISDFQRHDWVIRPAREGEDAETASALTPLKAWADNNRGLRVSLINVGTRGAANRAIAKISLDGRQVVAGTDGVLNAEILNYSSRPMDGLNLRLTVGSLAHPAKEIDTIAPFQRAEVGFEAQFRRAGFETIRVDLPLDSLPLDDVRYHSLEVVSAVRLLVVDGEPSADDFNDEVSLLATALRPQGDIFSGNEVVVINDTELEETNLSTFHAVILANVYRLSEPGLKALEQFTADGGGVLFFLGDQVDADVYNSNLYRDGEGLLPVLLSERIRAATATNLVVVDRLHPAMQGVAKDGDPLGLSRVPFYEFFSSAANVAPDGGDDETRSEGVGIQGSDIPRVQIIARFDDEKGNPAIVEKSFGAGRVVLIATSADKEWHQWPDHPTFLPVMLEMVQHVAKRGDSVDDQRVGEPIQLALDPALYEPDITVRTPAYPSEREIGLTAKPTEDGEGWAATWDHTDRAGFYKFILRGRDGNEIAKTAAVNVDPREGDLAMAEEAELRSAMPGIDFDYIEGLEGLNAQAGETRTEFWRAALLVVLVVLMGEQTLAWAWGRKR